MRVSENVPTQPTPKPPLSTEGIKRKSSAREKKGKKHYFIKDWFGASDLKMCESENISRPTPDTAPFNLNNQTEDWRQRKRKNEIKQMSQGKKKKEKSTIIKNRSVG